MCDIIYHHRIVWIRLSFSPLVDFDAGEVDSPGTNASQIRRQSTAARQFMKTEWKTAKFLFSPSKLWERETFRRSFSRCACKRFHLLTFRSLFLLWAYILLWNMCVNVLINCWPCLERSCFTSSSALFSLFVYQAHMGNSMRHLCDFWTCVTERRMDGHTNGRTDPLIDDSSKSCFLVARKRLYNPLCLDLIKKVRI